MDEFINRKQERTVVPTAGGKMVDLVAAAQSRVQVSITAENVVHSGAKKVLPWMSVFGIPPEDAKHLGKNKKWLCYLCRPAQPSTHGRINATNCRNHLESRHKQAAEALGVGAASGGNGGARAMSARAKREADELLFEFLVGNALPLNLSRDPTFAAFMEKISQGGYVAPSPRVLHGKLAADTTDMQAKFKETMEDHIGSGRNVAISCDVWSRHRSFLGLMVHWIDGNFQRRTHVAAVTYVGTGKSAAELATYVRRTLEGLSIDPAQHVSAIVTDGAGDMQALPSELGLETRWVYCIGHRLNRAIGRALGQWRSDPNVGAATFLDDCQQFVKTFRHGYAARLLDSEQRKYFNANPRVSKRDGRKLRRPLRLLNGCFTRWTSMFRMLQRLQVLQPVLQDAQTAAVDVRMSRRGREQPIPLVPCADLVDLYVELLAPVTEIIQEMQGSGSEACISKYQHALELVAFEMTEFLSKLGVEQEEGAAGAHAAATPVQVESMVRKGSTFTASAESVNIVARSARQILRHVRETHVPMRRTVLAAQALDPRICDLLEPAERAIAEDCLREKLREEVAREMARKQQNVESNAAAPPPQSLSRVERLRLSKRAHRQAEATPATSSEAIAARVDVLLAEALSDVRDADTDINTHWSSRSRRSPELVNVARDLLSIMGHSADLERLYCYCGRTLSGLRLSMGVPAFRDATILYSNKLAPRRRQRMHAVRDRKQKKRARGESLVAAARRKRAKKDVLVVDVDGGEDDTTTDRKLSADDAFEEEDRGEHGVLGGRDGVEEGEDEDEIMLVEDETERENDEDADAYMMDMSAFMTEQAATEKRDALAMAYET